MNVWMRVILRLAVNVRQFVQLRYIISVKSHKFRRKAHAVP